jgi:cyclophilin family peptidyl-prolyl cis-trans isomerase
MAQNPDGGSRASRALRLAVVSAVLVGALLVYHQLWGPGSDDDNPPPRASDTPAADGTQAAAGDSSVTTVLVDPGTPVEPTCPAADGSSPRQVNFSAAPPMCIDATKVYVATVDTNRGAFEITLDPARAPLAVNNFIFLAQWHYYDGVGFHRIIPGFVVQGGDAVGPTPGFGGPGYEFADELPATPPFYPDMSVAMANSGPNTNGSQFFIVVGPDGEGLPPNYTRFGTVTAGTPVVDEIEDTGNPRGTTPSDLTVINTITVVER